MANDFSEDSNCKALWSFESGAMLADSIGGNTLYEDTAYGEGYCTITTVGGTYKEKSGALRVDDTDEIDGYTSWLRCEDADLDAGFPLKSGDTTKTISVAGWVKPLSDTSGGSDKYWVQKYHPSNTSLRTFEFGWRSSGDELILRVFRTGPASEYFLTDGAGIALGTWYHYGLALDGLNKTYLIRLYNADTDTAQTFSGSLNYEMMTPASPLLIGRLCDAYNDEIVVFSDLLTASDFDKIRAGTYGGVEATIPAETTHSHAADQATVVRTVIFSPVETLHFHDAEMIGSYSPVAADQAHAVDSPGLSQMHIIPPADVLHSHLANRVTVRQSQTFAPTDVSMAHNVESPAVYEVQVCLPDHAAQGHSCDAPTWGASAILDVLKWPWLDVAPRVKWSLRAETPKQRVFIVVLKEDGLDDFEVPVQTITMRIRDTKASYISCIIPNPTDYTEDILARVDGRFHILAGEQTLDGQRHLEELIYANIDNLYLNQGDTNNLSLTGLRYMTHQNPQAVEIGAPISLVLTERGKRRVRAAVDFFMKPNDVVTALGETFTVELITFVITPYDAFMDVEGS